MSNLLFGKAGGSKYQGGVNLVDPKTGQTIPVEAVSGNVYGEPAEVSAIVTILHDRTEAIEREQLYEQLKAASAQLERRVQEATSALVHQNELLRRQAIELEQASVAKSQFLANVSHDVRTPLNAILGYTSLLLRGVSGPIDPSQRESLARVDANARHLLTLINEILDISRIEAGKMPVRTSAIKLNELIDEIMSEVEPLIATSNLAVTANIPRRAARHPERPAEGQADPAEPSHERAQVHPSRLGDGVLHARAFEPGDRDRRRRHGYRHRGQGSGSDLRGVLAGRTHAPTREAGGTGLGLAICRRLATVLGGRITLESKLRQGSTFTLILPLGPRRS